MTAPCFHKRFYEETQEDFEKSFRIMKAAVAAACAGGDEAIRQASIFSFLVNSLERVVKVVDFWI